MNVLSWKIVWFPVRSEIPELGSGVKKTELLIMTS